MTRETTAKLAARAATDHADGLVDAEAFRSIMSAFPTGVAVITTCDREGEFKGFTSNAVTSVSLDPPLLLVCVARTSETLPALRHARRFVVNFLRSGGQDLSTRFARKGPDKFDGVACSTFDGLPVLSEHTVAHAVCATEQEVDAGDHLVLIGRVTAGKVVTDGEPLLYYRRRYPTWART